MFVKQKSRQFCVTNLTFHFLVAEEMLFALLQLGVCPFWRFFRRNMHGVARTAKFEVELKFSLEKVATTVRALLILNLRIGSHTVASRNLLDLHD